MSSSKDGNPILEQILLQRQSKTDDVKQLRKSQKNFERKFTNFMKQAEEEKVQEEELERRNTDRQIKEKMEQIMREKVGQELLRKMTI